LFGSVALFAQNMPKRDSLPVNLQRNAQSAFNVEPTRPRDFEDYLVQLALTNSPETEASQYQLDIARNEISLAKKDWTRNLSTSINFNESNYPYFLVNTLGVTNLFGREIDLARVPNTVNFPLWNFGATINFGDLIFRKHKVRIAEDKRKLTELELTKRKFQIRADVLTLYQKYLLTFEVVKTRLQALDAAQSNQISVANLYAINKARIEDYNEANRVFFEALESKIRAETEIKIAKYALEEVIGTRWENVEKIKASYEEQEKTQNKKGK
jgi:outer membrane protein TolC